MGSEVALEMLTYRIRVGGMVKSVWEPRIVKRAFPCG